MGRCDVDIVHVEEVAVGCSISKLVSIATLCDDVVEGFRPVQNSSGDRTSHW